MRKKIALALVLAVVAAADTAFAQPATQPGVFVPAPKGSGESLDSLPPAGTAGQGGVHQLTTLCGDRITGMVLTIDSAGKIRLTGPQFDGAVTVLSSAVDTVTLNGKSAEGKDELQLTSGDRLRGEIVSITPSTVQINTPAAGSLNVNRRFVRAAMIGRGATVLVESDFAKSMAPWITGNPGLKAGGDWKVENGSLVCHGDGGGESTLWTRLEQKEAVTMVCKFNFVSSVYGSTFGLVLFADSTNPGTPAEHNWILDSSGVIAAFDSHQFYINYAHPGRTETLTARRLPRTFRGGTVRFAYDPETGKSHLWLDEKDQGEYDMPNKPKSGQFLVLSAPMPLKIAELKILRGLVSPSGDVSVSVGSADETTVQFANHDRVSAQEISLSDGQFVITTSHGELKSPLDAVQCIVFGKKETEEPRRQKGDVRVDLGSSRLTLKFDQLTEDSLLGRSDAMGEVKVKRAAVRSLAFNIYRDAGRAPPADQGPVPSHVINMDGDL